MTIKFEGKLKAGIRFDEEVNAYITYAPAVDIYSQGESVIDAKTALEDAVTSFLHVAYKMGVLSRQLEKVECAPGEYINVDDTDDEVILKKRSFSEIFEVPAALLFSCSRA